MAVWNLNPRTLVANSGLAVCSRAPETGGPTFAAVWMVVVGGSAEFATRSTARGGTCQRLWYGRGLEFRLG